jgi:hypothetical protein
MNTRKLCKFAGRSAGFAAEAWRKGAFLWLATRGWWRSEEGMPPRVFMSKSAQGIENKGSEYEKKLQESSRVRKR